ncbi:methanogenesis marker protein 11 [Methanobrevibacter arboriphilus]|uniref:methanogenesis marker protein 11 n=1 Tax=Methanobrevibacter arboriphilus TaxID=39441 RepID=UPI0005B27399|nr:methanogenesis marker protein 11 [Methanobrevibacter arboriphilus]
MEILKPNDLKKKFNDPWIAPYEKVITMADNDLVEIVEYHPCISGSHWLVNQYKNTSKLILNAYRDGNKQVFLTKVGKEPLNLKASVNAAGIEEVAIDDENDTVKVVHSGLAGAGVGAGMCRGMGDGIKQVEIYEKGGGSKLGKAGVITPKMEKVVIGIDDTDTKDEGATWTMAHNVGIELKKEGFEYLDHIIVQLYPHNPHKTQNCVSIALTFAVFPEEKEKLIKRAIELLKRDTLSDKTAIAILNGITIPQELVEYSMKTKTSMVSVEEAEKVAKDLNIQLIAVTGDHGKIGALAALGLYNNPDEAVKVYY